MRTISKPIRMIAIFEEDGTPTPVRFKILNKDSSYSVIKVDKVVSIDKEKLASNPMLIFKCESAINNINRLYELKYELNTCKWIMFKM